MPLRSIFTGRVSAATTVVASLTIPPLATAAEPELVLYENVRLTATTASGTLSLLAREGLARTFEWEGCSLELTMGARSSRWYGALGAHGSIGGGPVSSMLGKLFACQGIFRPVAEEAQIHFADKASAEQWIERYSRTFATVWTNDGLLVQWGVTPSRQQLNVDVWQICVSGRKPNELSGADDERIQVARLAGSGVARRDCAVVENDVMLETQRVWRQHWREADEWKSRLKR